MSITVSVSRIRLRPTAERGIWLMNVGDFDAPFDLNLYLMRVAESHTYPVTVKGHRQTLLPLLPYIIKESVMKRNILPANCLFAWAKLNGVTINQVELKTDVLTVDGVSKGVGLVSTCDQSEEDGESILISIPADLVLGQDQVHQYAITDPHLKAVLDAVAVVDGFGQVSAPLV
jgi:hypothetical protein